MSSWRFGRSFSFLYKWVICRFQPLIFQCVTPWFLVVLPGDIGESWTKVGTLRRCRRGAEVCFHGFFSGDFWEVGRGEDTHNFHQKRPALNTRKSKKFTSNFCKRNSFFYRFDECVSVLFFKAFLSLWISVRKCFMTFRSAGVAVIQSRVVSSFQEGCCHSLKTWILGANDPIGLPCVK